MQRLTKKRVYEAATRAMKEKRLGYQLDVRDCLYDYSVPNGGSNEGCGCAIGVSLNPRALAEVHKKGLNGVNLSTLQEQGVVRVPERDIEDLLKLQSLHDSICNHDTNYPGAKRKRDDFTRFLRAGLKEVAV